MESVINDYISREIVQNPALLPLSNDASLLEGGILDSLSLLRLVVFLEERFNIAVGDADLLPENFDTVNTIGAYLRARQPGKQEAAHAGKPPGEPAAPRGSRNLLGGGGASRGLPSRGPGLSHRM